MADPGRLLRLLRRLALLTAGVLVFILGLLLMKEGVVPLTPFLRTQLSVSSPASALGFGWILSSLALSGSPVAATALSFLDAGALSIDESFAMITGSRLGAAFVVVLVGFVYMLRGRSREMSLGAGLLALLVTQSTYLPALFIGLSLLRADWFNGLRIASEHALGSPLDPLLEPIIGAFSRLLPVGLLLPIGFGVIFFSFRLIDRALPALHIERTDLGRINRLLYRPLATFLLGAAVTSVTLSVSISLSLLVPLSARGYIRQENGIPYIMGANITTFVDTLVAAALLGNHAELTGVLAEMASVGMVSLFILLFVYRPYERAVVGVMRRLALRRRPLSLYIAAIFVVPIILLFFL